MSVTDAPPSSNGKLTHDQCRARELAILDDAEPLPLGKDELERLARDDPEAIAKVDERLDCQGPPCPAPLCCHCVNRRRYLWLCLHRLEHGRPRHPSEVANEPRLKPIPASALTIRDPQTAWLWRGYLAPDNITLFSALWKSGKTTLLAHLIRALGTGEDFCGLGTAPARVLYVSEESEGLWARRRDTLGLADHVHFLLRPFRLKPSIADWRAFLRDLEKIAPSYDLMILDTLVNLWPIRDENDASAVQDTLMPLRGLSGLSVALVHHLRKGDGQEATASRGSGALPAFADIIMELRRHDSGDRSSRRRVLTGYGRWDETPGEVVVELDADGTCYRALGDKNEVHGRDLRGIVFRLLPSIEPGYTFDEIKDKWPEKVFPTKAVLMGIVGQEIDSGTILRAGTGRRGDPYTYWASPP